MRNKKTVEKKVVVPPVVEKEVVQVKEVVEEIVASAVEKEEEAKKPIIKKPVAKKPATKKPATKKVTAVKKEVTKKSVVEIKEVMYLQFAGKTYTQQELIKIAKDVWKYDLNRKISEIEEIDLFVKPEDSLVYFVVNGETSGSFAI